MGFMPALAAENGGAFARRTSPSTDRGRGCANGAWQLGAAAITFRGPRLRMRSGPLCHPSRSRDSRGQGGALRPPLTSRRPLFRESCRYYPADRTVGRRGPTRGAGSSHTDPSAGRRLHAGTGIGNISAAAGGPSSFSFGCRGTTDGVSPTVEKHHAAVTALVQVWAVLRVVAMLPQNAQGLPERHASR